MKTVYMIVLVLIFVAMATAIALDRKPDAVQEPCTCACKPEGCYVAQFENAKCALWTNEHGQEQSCCVTR